MRGSFHLNHPEPMSILHSTESILAGAVYAVHPAQIPGHFVEVWGYYTGPVDATFRLRLEPSDPTALTGEELCSVSLTADQGFFYAAFERTITSQAFILATGQLASDDPDCEVSSLTIQLSCETRPATPPPHHTH